MISVQEAEQIILEHRKDFGLERVLFSQASGRVLAETITADRDLPPFDRVSMDGVSILFEDFEKGARAFRIAATIAAGSPPPLDFPKNVPPIGSAFCFETMTGAALSPATDSVVPYEQIEIEGETAFFRGETIKKGQNIHPRGQDRRKGEAVIEAGRRIGPAEIGMLASVGKAEILVKKRPRIAVVSSGDELVDVADAPLEHQIRRSNSYQIESVLRLLGLEAELFHLPDDLAAIRLATAGLLKNFDAIILSGGVSMGKFDFLPAALEAEGVKKLFHKVRQRPGKPFWFGVFDEKVVVFALPGNPVSTFFCLHRYFLPWLEASFGLPPKPPRWAVLAENVRFEPPLAYFLPIKWAQNAAAQLVAEPFAGRGSGDFSNLLAADAFLELPAERTDFEAGEIFRAWPFQK